MAGGLLQLVSFGIQNRYLTVNPEITFFKIAYHRHTHFGKENVLLNYDQTPDFNKNISFTVPNNGDILSNITLHFNFSSFYPNLNSLSDNLKILNQNKINLEKEELLFLKANRDNLNKYSNIIFGAIKIIEKYQNTINISLPLIINLISSYQKSIVSDFNNIKDLISSNILEKSNIFKFVLEDNIFQTIDDLIIKKNEIKKYLITRTQVLNNRILTKNKLIYQMENYPILYKWKNRLANLLVEHVELEIDGEIIDRITSEEIDIYYQCHYSNDEKNKMLKLIEGKAYQDFELFLPLNFWFKESYGLGIPIVSLRYSTIKFNVSLKPVENLIDIIILDDEYEKIKKISFEVEGLLYEKYEGYIQIDNNLYDATTLNYNKNTETLTLSSEFIYKDNLIENLYINSESADLILNTFGSIKNDLNLSLDLNEFKNFVNNISSLNIAVLSLELNLNRLELTTNYNLENADLYCEYIYLDQIEREKFASSRLNYLIKLHSVNTFELDNTYFNKNLEIENYVTEMYWTLQKKSELTGTNFESPQYQNLLGKNNIENFQMTLNNYGLFFKKNSPEYFQYITSFNHLNSNFLNNIFFYSFCLYPEHVQPSGGISFNDINGKQFQINLKNLTVDENNKVVFKIFYKKLSILTISSGKGKLAFFN
ncbi:putative capsid protein 3 [Cafeteria roenbergensis virus]|uniref:Putative capsid protein 3 n=1 Tax=Cafeteria roenbergensis virus (strain BV-PW1) TaxID=693272 RepID=E3T592_CROVB|nr:putative capsid protein 3 [Cafeteria roenbergensis virus BV-PW1]ADO67355.1 putative capsid protein 3 [Cafeteria roenbergensis virus BV-PW1]